MSASIEDVSLYIKYCRIRSAPFFVQDDELMADIEKQRPNFPFVYSLHQHWAIPHWSGNIKLEGGRTLTVNRVPTGTLKSFDDMRHEHFIKPFDQEVSGPCIEVSHKQSSTHQRTNSALPLMKCKNNELVSVVFSSKVNVRSKVND